MTPVLAMSKREILTLLGARGAEQEALFARAREAQIAAWGRSVLLRGVIELTSYCRKDCGYCAMRVSNRDLTRYRLTLEEALQAARSVAAYGIRILLLQGGEDVQSDRMLEQLIPCVKEELGLFIILNVGERRRERFARFRELGADAFIMKFESADAALYERATRSRLEDRLRNLGWLKELGFVVGTGSIVGLPGQSLENVAEDLLLAARLQPEFVSTAPFIPNAGTPWESAPPGNVQTALNFIAISRLLLPQATIPAVSALEKLLVGGQALGLQAGANVLTVNFTPPRQRERYPIYSDRRFVVSLDHATQAVERAGLQFAAPPRRPLASGDAIPGSGT